MRTHTHTHLLATQYWERYVSMQRSRQNLHSSHGFIESRNNLCIFECITLADLLCTKGRNTAVLPKCKVQRYLPHINLNRLTAVNVCGLLIAAGPFCFPGMPKQVDAPRRHSPLGL